MASESTLAVNLPDDLDEWLSDRADADGVDRETAIRQLLASYRAAEEFDSDVAAAGTDAIETTVAEELEEQLGQRLQGEIEDTVTSVLAETLDDRVQSAVESEMQAAVESVVTERLSEATEAVRQQVGERVDAVEAQHESDIEDVRGRVVQLKRELDGKAAAGHDHEELEALTEEVETLETTLSALEEQVESSVPEHEVLIEDMDERLDKLQERMKTIAWVVSDLREAVESGNGVEAVERIKRAAAKADIDRAKCENCGEGVNIALLTDPECPHCQATVTNVEGADSFFSSPRLLTASQLESGDGK